MKWKRFEKQVCRQCNVNSLTLPFAFWESDSDHLKVQMIFSFSNITYDYCLDKYARCTFRVKCRYTKVKHQLRFVCFVCFFCLSYIFFVHVHYFYLYLKKTTHSVTVDCSSTLTFKIFNRITHVLYPLAKSTYSLFNNYIFVRYSI